MTLVDWGPIIVAVISAAAAIYAVWLQRRKDKTDIATAIGDAWSKLIVPLEERVAALEQENQKLRQRERILWNYIDALRARLRENNIDTGTLPRLPSMEEKDEGL